MAVAAAAAAAPAIVIWFGQTTKNGPTGPTEMTPAPGEERARAELEGDGRALRLGGLRARESVATTATAAVPASRALYGQTITKPTDR